MWFIGALWRVHTQRHHHRKWFYNDKPSRIRNGYTPDGLYLHERSEGDKERAGMKDPDELGKCAELRRGWGR